VPVGNGTLRSRLGRVAVCALLGALALTFAGLAASLAVILVAAVGLSVRPAPRGPGVRDAHACGSCGRCFDSRRELRAHREAVHARAFAMHSS
jgi:hypothetical protein